MRLVQTIKLSIALLLAVAANKLQAQSNTLTFSADETGVSQTHVVCKEIRLKPGYRYAASASTSMRSYIDPNMICNVDYTNGFSINTIPPLNTSYEVGSTPGSFAVSSTGAASYNIPILVPPGTAGMVPNLSVVYNSQGGNGPLGVAWNLAGLSSIARVGQNLYHESKITGVELSLNDRFALDGNRLLKLVSDEVYGGNGIRYGTELESFSRITSYDEAGTTGTAYFIVETKDGSTMEYGKTADSRIEATGSSTVLTWLLNKVTDSRGNYMKFYYYENNATGEYRPNYIEYTGNAGAGLLPYNKVQFVYGTRQDKQRIYVAGHQVDVNTLLTGILTFEGSNRTHEYVFDYAYDINSHLKEITESGIGLLRYNSTKFVWNGNNVNPSSSQSSIALTPGKFTHTCDINGDGFDDVIDVTASQYRTFINDKNGGFAAGNWTNYTSLGSNISGTENHKPDLINSDFNGDGFDDIAVLSTNSTGKVFRCSFLKSNGSDLVQDLSGSFEITPTNPSNNNNWAKFKYSCGDFDGDGAADLFVYFYDADEGYLRRFRSDASLITEKVVNSDMGDVNLILNTVDMNADGKQEILLTRGASSYLLPYDGLDFHDVTGGVGFPQSTQRVYPGDFNGDGKTDLLSWSTSGWFVNYATGNGLGFSSFWAYDIPNLGDPNNYTTYHRYFVRDFNGDGKSDILDVGVPNGNGTTFFAVYYSNGNAYSFPSSFTYGTGTALESYQMTTQDANHDPVAEFLGDFDGDGRSEIYYNAKIGTSSPTCKVTFMPGPDIHKVNTIVDGFANKIHIDYNTLPILSKVAQYSKGSGASYPLIDFQKAITVVSACNSNHDLFGDYNSVSYSYTGAKIHLRGKGFLGFTKFKNTNASTGFTTEDSYNTTYSWLTGKFFQPVLDNSKTTTTAGDVSEKIMTQYTFRILPGNRYYFYCDSWSEIDYLHGNSTAFSMTQDTWGNVLTQVSNNSAGYSTTTNTYEMKGAWIPSRLVTSQTVSTRLTSGVAEPSYTRSTTFENNGLGGLPSKKIEDVGVTTEYFYNAFGLPETTKVSGTLITDRYTYALYDAQKRFVTKVTNPLSHIVESTYDPAYGNVLTKKDANGLIESFVYNGFGRLEESTSPTGSKATSTLIWDIASNYIYKSTTTDAGGSYSKKYYDPLGRAVKAETNNFDGSVISTTKTYNLLGQLVTETEPNNTGLFTSYEYESDYKRLRKITSPSGATKEYQYNNNTTITTTTDAIGAKITSSTTDAAGLVTSSTDADGNTLTYLYHSSGQPRQITAPGNNAVTTIVYDAYGRQTKLTDPNAGLTSYAYDVLGQLISQQTAKQLAAGNYFTTMTYDELGRVKTKVDPQEGIITNTYDPANGKGMLASITTTGAPNSFNVNCAYTYDSFSRLKTKTETIPGISVNPVYTYDYDNLGRVTTVGYPSHTGLNSFSVTNTYNTNGYLSETRKTSDNSLIWQCNTMNPRGQVTQSTLGNQVVYNKGYSNLGFLQSQTMSYNSANLVAFTYVFEPTTGNLQNRNTGNGILESFQYDNLDRLSQVSHIAAQSTLVLGMDYTGNGNINNKSDVGDYVYGTTMPPAGPHAVIAINNPSSSIPTLQQDILYTAFNKAKSITEGTYAATISYGFDQQRRKMVVTNSGSTVVTKYYVGDYEKTISGTVTRELHYLGDAIFVKNTTGSTVTDSMYYIHADHLGSIATVFDQNRNIKAKYSYDSWGRRRNYTDYTYTLSGLYNQNLFDRFYTGHESIPLIGGTGGGLINMNGRMYDPLIARMLSTDNYVQAAGYTQSYNRYSYCINNPLKYTDPSGDIFFVIPSIGYSKGGGLDVSITAGVGIPGILSAQATVGHSFGNKNTYGTLGGTAVGANASVGWGTQTGFTASLSYGLTFGIPNGFGSNLTSLGVSYSQYGGFSANAFGFSYGRGGLHFDPSISYSKSYIFDKKRSPVASPLSNDLYASLDEGITTQTDREKNVPGGDWDIWGEGYVPYDGDAWGGTNFIGPGPDPNPYYLPDPKHEGEFLKPIDRIDQAAQKHDYAYYRAGAGGIIGALLDRRVAFADAMLTFRANKIMNEYSSGNSSISPRTYNLSYAVYNTFLPITISKYSIH